MMAAVCRAGMKLTFLGTGSAMPGGRRVQTGALLHGRDGPVLVDCGSGVLHRLAESETDYTAVETILLTHHHLDHVSDVLNVATARWLAGEPETEVVGPPGTTALIDDVLDAFEYLRDESLEISVREIDAGEGPFTVAGWEVEAHETEHSVYTLAYRFGDAVTIGADSEAVSHLIDFAAGSDVLVHDCSFIDDIDVANHPTPSQLGEVLAGHGFERVYLTHLYPMTDGHHSEMRNAIQAHYDGRVEFASDGLTVEL
jgi:ribonuclease BN (tRNA processing enzyme)